MGVIRDVLDEVDDESKDMSGTGVTLPPLECTSTGTSFLAVPP